MKKLYLMITTMLFGAVLFLLPAYGDTRYADYYVQVTAPDGGVHFRTGPGVEYAQIISGLIPNGTTLHVEQESQAANGNYWGNVYYSGNYGWVALTQCTQTSYSPGGTWYTNSNVQVAADNVYLRSGAGVGYGKVLSDPIPYGTILYVTQQQTASNGNPWGYVYYNGMYGWVALTQCNVISSSYPSVPERYPLADHVNYNIQVSAPDGGVNLRSAAGVENNRLLNYMVPNGTVLHVFFEDKAANGNSWGFVKYDGVWGWVALTQCVVVNAYADSTPDYSVEVNAEEGGINFRSGAGVEYGTLISHMIPNGTILHITQEAAASNGNYWGLTIYEGLSGWVTLRQIRPAAG